MARKAKHKKPVPQFINFSEAANFIETDVEVEKETLIERCAGKVSYEFFQMIKLLGFHSIGKSHDGTLYII